MSGFPQHWREVALRHISAMPIRNGIGEAGQDQDEGFIRYIRTTDIADLHRLDESKRAGVPLEVAADALIADDDILMTAAGSLGTSYLAKVGEPAAFAGYLVRWRVDATRCNPRYFAWWTSSRHHLDQIATGAVRSTIDNFSASKFRSMRAPLPPLHEQREIADFLDRETAQIDAMIEAQQLVVDHLEERRQSVIHHLVTKGVVAGADLRETGSAWVGEIPTHWRIDTIRRHAAMKTGHTPSRGVPAYWEDCTIPWMTLADVWQLRPGRQEYVTDTEEKVSLLGIANSAAELLPAGTVMLSRTASVGFSGIMAQPMATSQDYWNWVCGPSLLPDYLLYVFRAMTQEFDAVRRGSTHQTIYQPVAAAFTIPVPPLREQRPIVEAIRRTLKSTDAMVDSAQGSMVVLRERREALITAAVTGRIDPTTGIERIGPTTEREAS